MNYECGKVDIEELLACSLNLKKSEYKIFKVLFKEERALTAIEVSDMLTLDRTTVQKVLKKFLENSLVQRFQENLENGGYLFRYKVKDKQNIKRHIRFILKRWYDSGNEMIEKL
jgi:predicted transcriptional regulator